MSNDKKEHFVTPNGITLPLLVTKIDHLSGDTKSHAGQILDRTTITTETTAIISLKLANADGIKDYSCQVYVGGTPIGSVIAPTGWVCTVSGLTPNTAYSFVEKALVAVKGADWTIVWVSGEVITLFRTKVISNTPPMSIVFFPATLTTGSLTSGQSAGLLGCIDLERPNCTYSLTSQSTAWAFAVSAAGAVTVMNTGLASGSYTITVVATVAGGLTLSQTKTITVNAAANTAPTNITFTPTTLTTGSLSSGQSAGSLACNDAESPNCTYSLTSQSTAGAFAVSAGGAVTVVNTGLASGSYTITVVATNAGGLIVSQTKTITVSADLILTGPALQNVTISDNDWVLPITPINVGGVIDPLGRAVTYSASGLPTGFSINPVTGVISWMHDAFGDEVFGITVNATPNEGSNSLVRSFTLSIVDQG